MMDPEHIARCNQIIPTIVRAFPSWDLLVHIPEEEWTYENFLKRGSSDGLVRFMVIEVVEGSEDASDEDFRDRCVGLVENAIGDLREVSHAIENFSPDTLTDSGGNSLPREAVIEKACDNVRRCMNKGELVTAYVEEMSDADLVDWATEADGKFSPGIEIGDKVLITDPEEQFEGTVVDVLFTGNVTHAYVVECKYGTQNYDLEMVTFLEKGETEDE